MIQYSTLGLHKKLHQIIFAGSHDAGITGGDQNVKTQELNILPQATAGVRLFDLRITGAATLDLANNQKIMELRAYHADDMVRKDEKKTRILRGFAQQPATFTRSKLHAGDFGETLRKILDDAKAFVTSPVGQQEFLILKFDKCFNWGPIAQQCVTCLGNVLYRGGGNINTKTLADLAGKVIVVFSSKGLRESQTQWRADSGILGFKNLAKKEDGEGAAYDPHAWGLQYYGEGGTNPINFISNKTKENEKKQGKLMTKARQQPPEVIRMMYWTSTGMKESIERRNDGMWEPPNRIRLLTLWRQGLSQHVGASIAPNPLARAAEQLKFFPNVVMIDFATENRCNYIRELNLLTPSQLAAIQ